MGEHEPRRESAADFMRRMQQGGTPQQPRQPERPTDPRGFNLPPNLGQPQRQQQPPRQQPPRPQQAPRYAEAPKQNYKDSAPRQKSPEVQQEKKHLSRKALAFIIGGSVAAAVAIGGVSYEGDLFGIHESADAFGDSVLHKQPTVNHGTGVNTGDLTYRGETSLAEPTGTDTDGTCVDEKSAILYATVSGHMPLIPELPLKATATDKNPAAQALAHYLTGKNGETNINPEDAQPVDPKTDPNDIEGNLLFEIESEKNVSASEKAASEKVIKDFWAKSDNGYLEATINDVPLALHVCETDGAITTVKDKYGNKTGMEVDRSKLTLSFVAPPVRSYLPQTDGVDDAVKRLNQSLGQYETMPSPSYNLFLQQGANSPYDSTELSNFLSAYSNNQGKDYSSELFVQMEENAVQQLATMQNSPDTFGGADTLQDMVDDGLAKVLAKGGLDVSFKGGLYVFNAGDATSTENKASLSATKPKDLDLQKLSMQKQPDTDVFTFDGKPKVQFGYFVQPKITQPSPTPTSTTKPTPKPTATTAPKKK